MNNLQENGWNFADLKYLNLPEKTKEQFLLEKGDILFNRTNSKELVGKCDVFQENGEWIFASYLIRVRLNKEKALSQFVSDFLGTKSGRLQIDRISRQIIGMTNINAEELKDLQIPLPPLEIQRALVEEMEQARETRREKLFAADALLQSLDGWLLDILGIAPPPADNRQTFAVRFGDLQGRIDSAFYSPRYKHISKAIQTVSHSRLGNLVGFSKEVWDKKNHLENTFKYIEISGVDRATGEAKAEEILVENAPSRARMFVRTNDIIVSLTRPHHGSIAQIDESLNECIGSTGFAVLRDFNESKVYPTYIWAILRMQISLQQMAQRSSGGNYPAITEDELSNILIPLPDKIQQEQIVSEVKQRQIESRRLRSEAETEWQQAKDRFEAALLGGGE